MPSQNGTYNISNEYGIGHVAAGRSSKERARRAEQYDLVFESVRRRLPADYF